MAAFVGTAASLAGAVGGVVPVCGVFLVASAALLGGGPQYAPEHLTTEAVLTTTAAFAFRAALITLVALHEARDSGLKFTEQVPGGSTDRRAV